MMKKITIFIVLVLFGVVGSTVTSTADITKGQKLFKKKFRKACRFSGVKFARKHTQDEWADIYKAGKFPDEAKKICPRLKLDKVKKSWWPHIYDFAHEYAAGSAHVPSC
jgi:hypothetical protein